MLHAALRRALATGDQERSRPAS